MVTKDYYPYSDIICHHFYNQGGCTFCAYFRQERSVSPVKVTIKEMKAHFDNYAKENLEGILKQGRLIVAPNGSWFAQVPKALREYIYKFVARNGLRLKYECRATLFNESKARKELRIMYKKLFKNDPEKVKKATEAALKDITDGWGEIEPNHMVSFGLEVANDEDLKVLNKGCCLDDYVRAANFVHEKEADVCCNILIAPPRVEDPIYKAFETARFAVVEELGAEELLVMPCIPKEGARAYNDWIKAVWNPISKTASSEILRILREEYPSVKFKDSYVFNFHGRHGRFKRKPGKWSEEEKEKERRKVRVVAEKIFLK